MYLLILYFPLIGCLWSGFFGHFLGKNGASLITLFCMFLSVLISFFIFYEIVLCNNICIIKLYKWIDIGVLNIYWEFLFDALTSVMLFVIVGISFCVHLYSIEYMYNDPHLPRFLSYLSLFTFFMIVLVTAANLLQLFIGWEGVGLCSYLLINFWYTRIAANKAAMKALIINKIGDVCLLLGIILFFVFYNSLEFLFINCSTWLIQNTVYLNTYLFWINIDYFSIILFLFIIGACAKSAQIGLHTWLPDAMEGPTPVSALIHAATMVTAGVFLLLRSVHILKYDVNSLLLVSFLGGITSFVAATIGLFQNDIKKIIAYSTCSQLGYMVLSCGLNNYSGSLFHLMNHAFFKALLFLSAGAIIHSMLDQQDVRRMGMLLRYLPVSYIMILVGSLTIMGIPFLTGFYSKDFILEYVYSSNIFLSFFLYWLGIVSAALTSFYSIKLLFLTFYNVHNSYFNVLYNRSTKLIVIHESKFLILTALIILFMGSVFIGYVFKDLFIGMGTDVWANTLDTESYKDSLRIFEVEFLPIEIKLIPIIFTLISAISSFLFFKFYVFIIEYLYIAYFYLRNFMYKPVKVSNITSNNLTMKKLLDVEKKKNVKTSFNQFIDIIFSVKKLVFNGYYFNEIYNYYLYKNKSLSFELFKNLDRGVIEYMGHLFIVNNIKKILHFFSKKNVGRIDYIVFVMVLGIIVISMVLLFLNIIGNYKILGILLLLLVFEIKDTWASESDKKDKK
jgi:NADH-ubiquinone oxidoreductase chain 5